MENELLCTPLTPAKRKSLARTESRPYISISSEDSTDMDTDTEHELDQQYMEEIARGEVQNWLSLHGAKLFSLEASKFFAKKKSLGSIKG